MESLRVMGFVDVFCAFPRLYKIFQKLKKHLLNNPIDVLICVDYPGFHLRLAKALRKKGLKGKSCNMSLQTVWAHGKSGSKP